MNSTILNIALLVCSGLLAILTNSVETKKDGKVTIAGRIANGLTILMFLFSILFVISSDDDNNKKFNENINRLDTLLNKADKSVNKMDSSLALQKNLQDSTRKIDSATHIQLSLQRQLITSNLKLLDSSATASKKTTVILQKANDLLIQNEELSKNQMNTLENTERIANSFSLNKSLLQVTVPFENPFLKKLVDSLYKIKEAIETGQSNKYDIIESFNTINSQVVGMRLDKPMLHLKDSFNYILGRFFNISFRKKPIADLYGEDVFLTIDLPVSNLEDVWYKFEVLINFQSKQFSITYLFDKILNEYSKNNLQSVNDFKDTYMVIKADNSFIDYTIRLLTFSQFPPTKSNKTISIFSNPINPENTRSDIKLFPVSIGR